MNKKIIFISGAISSDPNYKEKFDKKQDELKERGYIVLNPTRHDPTLEYEDLMTLCRKDIEQCDILYLLKDWMMSAGAMREVNYVSFLNATSKSIQIMFESEDK